jgi:peptide/nickel transport system permease protein
MSDSATVTQTDSTAPVRLLRLPRIAASRSPSFGRDILLLFVAPALILTTIFVTTDPVTFEYDIANPDLWGIYMSNLSHRSRLHLGSNLVGFFLIGIFGPALVGRPEGEFLARHQPPYGLAVSESKVIECIGPVSDGMCHGTLAHPLGTTGFNQDVRAVTVESTQVALQVSVVTARLVVPSATAVGTGAAQFGGWVDELLMRYVDIQQTIPPFFVYIVAQFLIGPSLLLIVGIFGLLNWGGTARLVRSEALAKREAEYVLAARSAGSSSLRTVRKHIVPNVSNTVLTAVTLQMPALIVIEATLSYLGIGPDGVGSWGNIIFHGMENFPIYWWVAVFPVLAILVTVVAFYVLGDALRDTLDPRLREAT